MLGKLAGTLPSILDPATSSYHKGICHSVTTGAAIVYGVSKVKGSNISSLGIAALQVIAASYLGHLIKGAQTPRGLPLISK